MNFEKKYTFGFKKLKEEELMNSNFTSDSLKKVMSYFGIWRIGIIVTCKERLMKRYGIDDYKNEIHPRLIALAIQLKAVILDVCSNDYKVVDKKIKELRSKIINFPFPIRRRVKYIQIIGDHDIVPFSELPNNAPDLDILYTDDVYADFTNDDVIDVAIARIPDGTSLDLLVRQLDQSSTTRPGAFGLANSKREYAGAILDIFDDALDVYWSDPMTNDDFSVSDVDVELVYFILHGSKDTSIWTGAEYTYPTAFTINLAACQGTLLSGCCYGAYIIDKTPADSISLRFLRSGIKAFVGCTGIHYSTPGYETHYNGPLFHKLFFEYLMAGNKPSKAFLKAKRAYSLDADTDIEEKILHEFVFYGRL